MEVEAGPGPRPTLPERRVRRWSGFDLLDEHNLPHIKRCHAADEELIAVERPVANNEEVAPVHLEAAKNEHELAVALCKSAVKHYIGYDE